MKSTLFILALAQAALTSATTTSIFSTSTTRLSSTSTTKLSSASTTVKTVCNADNCARAVTGTRFATSVQSEHRADCSSFLRTTVTPKASTVNATVTVTVTAAPVKRDGDGMLQARQVTQTPSLVPSYASACSGTAGYSSACSCFGVTAMTTTAPTPTTTVTKTVTATEPASTCKGSVCNSLQSCGQNCFCFETAEKTGFCGPGTSCAPLADCKSSKDCASGTVCLTGTCCGRNVCLGPQGCEKGVGISRRELFGRAAGDDTWTGGSPPSM